MCHSMYYLVYNLYFYLILSDSNDSFTSYRIF